MAGRSPKRPCARCGASLRARDRFCPSCGAPIAGGTASIATPSLQVEHAATGALAEQRKVVTVMFADLSGSTPLGERLDPEELRAILARYFASLSSQLRRYGATIDKYVGDAIMAVFGAPVSHEDDAERAIRAGLAMQGAIASLNEDLEREHGVRLALRIGINTGQVVAGLLADDAQHAYTVVGDTVNTAHRFESVAPLGEVVVSDMTRLLAIHRFEFAPLPAVALKGKRDMVVPYRVVRLRDDEILPESAQMLGRAPELAGLRDALGGALMGHGVVLNVVGEAGVGKSRLVLEFRRELVAGLPRLVARCASYEAHTPYALVADLLRATFGIRASDTEPQARARVVEGLARYQVSSSEMTATILLDVIGFGERADIAPDLKQQILGATTRELVRRATADLPLVVVMEDLQWMDRASAAILTELLRDVESLPVLVICTSRPGVALPWPAQTLTVGALADADARALTLELAEGELAPSVVDRILERTCGNPFFIEEVVREMRAGGSEIPATVQEVVEARLDRLEPEPRNVVDIAAIVGQSFWFKLIQKLNPGRALADSVDVLERLAFIVRRATTPELIYAFRQPILQEVAYEVQLHAVRRAEHERVGDAIATLYADRLEEATDLLAYHYARSDAKEKALGWLVRAGDRARALYANDEALRSYGDALRRAADGFGPRDAGTILEAIGDVQTLVGAYDDAIASYAAARQHGATSDRVILARLERKTGAAHRWKGDYGSALAALASARGTLADADDRELARIALQAGMAELHRGDYVAARAPLLEGVAAAERRAADDILAEGLKLLGNVANNTGDLPEAIERYRTSLEIYERLGDLAGIADLRSNLAMMFRRTGRYDEALAEQRAALAIRERIGHRWGVGTSHNNMGEVLRSMGRPAEAIPEFELAFETWSAISARAGAGLAKLNLGAACLETGDLGRATSALNEAERMLDGTKFLPGVHRELARAALAAGDVAGAWQQACVALELANTANARQTAAQVKRVMAEIALARGDERQARTLLEESRAMLVELGEAAELARTERVLAGIAGPHDASVSAS